MRRVSCPYIRRCTTIILIVATCLVLSSPHSIFAATGINPTINFQGKVVNSDGTNVPDGNYDFVFSLYNVDTAGTAQWTETWNTSTAQVAVKDGVFHVSLGTYSSLASLDFNNDTWYLGINFDSDGEMTPRVRLTAVPYAFNAQKVNGLTVTDENGDPFSSATTLKIADGKTVTIKNGLTFSGPDSKEFIFPSITDASDTVVTAAFAQTLTNKTIGSTGLTFSGAAIDITTATNENLVISPNGSGKIGLGSANPVGWLEVAANGLGNALAIFDQTDSAAKPDILSASSSGTTKFRIDYNGNVGVGLTGTDTLSSWLSLAAATTGKSSLNIASGVAPSAPQDGDLWYTGSSGSLYFRKGSTTKDLLSAATGSTTWDGLSDPAADLSLSMSTYKTAFNWATGTSTNNLFSLTTDASSDGTGYLLNLATGTSSTVKPLHVSAGGVDALTVDAVGNVGIGTTDTSSYDLNVDGKANISHSLFVNTDQLYVDGSNGQVGIGTSNIANDFTVAMATSFLNEVDVDWSSADPYSNGINVRKRGTTGDATAAVTSGSELGYHGFYGWDGTAYGRGTYALTTTTEDWNSTSHGAMYQIATTPNGSTTNQVRLTIDENGNVGIGTTNPAFSLDLKDKLGINGTQVLYLPDQTNFDGTLVIGDGGGSLSHVSGTDGQLNTFIGYGAGFSNTTGNKGVAIGANALYSNTTGLQNIAIGSDALNANDDGNYNAAIGERALLSNTSGTSNNAFGETAMKNNQTGSNNTALGDSALYSNISGDNNVALGYWSGYNSGVSLETNSNSVFLGANANTSIDGLTNAIAIGYNAQATASNQLVLGNTDITQTLLHGNVGIGTTTPLGLLDIDGAAVGKALATLNQTGNQAIFTASQGGNTKFIIDNSGNVGIGLTNPSQKLDIAGKVAINGTQVLYLPNQTSFNGTLILGDTGGSLTASSAIGDTFVGVSAGSGNTTGHDNTYLGIGSGLYNSTGYQNTFLGSNAGYGDFGGHDNIAIGFGAGYSLGSGSNNIIIGNQAGYSESGSNKLYIANSNTTSPLIGGKFDIGSVGINTDMTKLGNAALTVNQPGSGDLFTASQAGTTKFIINHSGNVGIGVTNPTSKLAVNGGLSMPQDSTAASSGITFGTTTPVSVYRSAAGVVTIGDGTNGVTIDTTSGGNAVTYAGNAQPSKVITLSPEYAGAVISADGSSSTNGSMTSDNMLNASGVGWQNYYQWTSTQATLQDYTVIVRVTLPQDFSSWQTGSCPGSTCAMEINYQTGVSGTTNNAVSIRVNNATTTPGTVICTISAVSSTTWTSTGCTSTNLATTPSWNTAGSTAVIRIKLAANSTASALARVGDIVLRYKAKF